jgi:flagellar motility protein MotE (MotC chaperone)/sporulation protein YlmC with PRC-barrel domain
MVHKFRFPTSKTNHSALKELRGSLITVSGLVGRKVTNQEGQELGKLVDLVCRWDTNEAYPPMAGIIIKVAHRQIWVPASNVHHVTPSNVLLGEAILDVRDFKPRQGEVRLVKEVLDHQLIDVNGARVVRATDLYIAEVSGRARLVAVDVGLKPLFRRLGPKGLSARANPDAVIDWATIQSFGGQEEQKRQLRLSANRQELRHMRPGELADLLEDLGRSERQELLSALTPDLAADALEEMEPQELEAFLRESSPKAVAQYLSRMEPDEAADALRDLDNDLREKLLAVIPPSKAEKVQSVLNYDEETAGGIMNSLLLTAPASDTVGSIKKRLKESDTDVSSFYGVVIIDKKGKLLYDLALVELLTASDEEKLEKLMKPPATLSVQPDSSLKEVAELLVETRGSSILVTDKKERPLGRIFADDMMDVLLPVHGRFRFPRLLS